jgi:hypothetical protein
MGFFQLTHEPWYQQCRLEIIRYLNDTYGREYRLNETYTIRNASIEEWVVFAEKEKISILFRIDQVRPNKKAVITIYKKVDSLDYFINQK